MPELIKKLPDFEHFCHIHSLLSKQEALLWLLSSCAESHREDAGCPWSWKWGQYHLRTQLWTSPVKSGRTSEEPLQRRDAGHLLQPAALGASHGQV